MHLIGCEQRRKLSFHREVSRVLILHIYTIVEVSSPDDEAGGPRQQVLSPSVGLRGRRLTRAKRWSFLAESGDQTR